MKKFYKLFATTLALALMVASPLATVTAHAAGLNMNAHDDTDYGDLPDDYWGPSPRSGGSSDSSSSDNSSSGSTETSAPSNPAPRVEDSSSNNSDNSPNNSSNNSSSDSGYSEPSQNAGNSGSTDSGSASTGNNVQSGTNQGTVIENPNDVTTRVQGGQPFRSVMDKEHMQYDVYHKGVSVASFSVTDKDGKRVEFKTVALEQGKDGLWYLNIIFAEGVDVKGLVLNLLKGDLAYLAKELGITGIQINGEVVALTNPETADAGTGTGKESDSKVTEEKKTDKTVKDEPVVEDQPAGYRVCWCGEKIAIENAGGLSASEKAEWKAHASAHLKNGESTSYTDIANKNASK